MVKVRLDFINETREKKTEIITLRVTPQVKERIRAKARELRLTVTDYLCLCGLGKRIVRVDGLDKVLSELKAQGRKLNQLTTLANMGKILSLIHISRSLVRLAVRSSLSRLPPPERT